MNLLKALATISSLTLVSRILAFVRDVLIARIFGAGAATDAFFVAFKLPNLLRRLFAEGAFSQAFVPIFGEYRNRRGHDETRLLVDHVTTMLAIILFVVTLVGIVAAPILVYISAPGFLKDAEKFDLTVQLLRITSPYIFFISLVAVAAGILNTYNKFWVPAFAPVLLNLCFIGGALWLAPYFDPPILALAWAVFVAGVVQLAFQLPFLKKIGMLPSIRFSLKDEGMWRVIKQMGPAVFGVSIAQISLIINTIFASSWIAMNVSARWETKRWPPQHFAEAADRLSQARALPILFIGGPAERPDSQAVISLMRRKAVDLTGQTPVRLLPDLLRRAAVLVTNDSGPMHIAAAVGTPVVALFGPTDPLRTGPYGRGHLVLSHAVDCSPCFQRRCSRAVTLECLTGVRPEQVVQIGRAHV